MQASHAADPSWTLFHRNETIWPAVLELCDGARESLEIEQYIFSATGIGRRLIELLAVKARQGVRVRILVDGFGSRALLQSQAAEDFRKAGGELVAYNPASALPRHPLAGWHRLHRKSVLCDGRVMMVGGSCFDDRMRDWRDTMVRIDGPTVDTARAAFENAWIFVEYGPGPEEEASSGGPPQPGAAWSYLISEPVPPPGQQIYRTLVEAISGAARSVMLTTPYFIPDPRIWRELGKALARGVKVRLLMPATSDHPSVDVASRWFARRLSAKGGEVYAYEPSMIHAKIALVDDVWASVSSFNIDILSIRMNVENGLVSHVPAFHDALRLQFGRDMANSRRC